MYLEPRYHSDGLSVSLINGQADRYLSFCRCFHTAARGISQQSVSFRKTRKWLCRSQELVSLNLPILQDQREANSSLPDQQPFETQTSFSLLKKKQSSDTTVRGSLETAQEAARGPYEIWSSSTVCPLKVLKTLPTLMPEI